jgi:prepilin-type N-terminal cleavage/methylation domain-containing protein
MHAPEPRRSVAGFTMIEVLMVLMLATVVLGSAFQLLINNQRMYTVGSARVDGLNSLRAAADILFGELRDLSTADNDIVAIGSDSITVRAAGAFGVVCATNYGATALTILSVAGTFAADDSVALLADNDPMANSDDVFVSGRISAVANTTCANGDSAQVMRINGVTLGSPPDSILEGSPVREFSHYTYGIVKSGDEYFFRRTKAGTTVILAGPLDGATGLRFEYEDSSGSSTSSVSSVALIRIVLKTASAATDRLGNPVNDSIVVEVQARN